MADLISAQHSRTAALIGNEGLSRLQNARVAVFGIGGVGGHLAEALARAGVGHIHLIDRDVVSLSNINRQAVALHSTVGRPKAEVMAERIRDINPDCHVTDSVCFYLPENAGEFDLSSYDFVADCVDTVSAKLELAGRCEEANTPIIAAMGAGNKMDATAFEVADLSKTSVCPLARIMRKELKKRGINHLKVVYSQEEALTPTGWEEEAAAIGKRQIPGSVSFVPGAAGLILAGEVIKDLARG